jgi:hypothetical protein
MAITSAPSKTKAHTTLEHSHNLSTHSSSRGDHLASLNAGTTGVEAEMILRALIHDSTKISRRT